MAKTFLSRTHVRLSLMNKLVLRYGLLLAVALLLLELLEYYYVVRIVPVPLYIVIIALVFTVLGIWMGKKVTSGSVENINEQPFSRNKKAIASLDISERELEVLEQLAKGKSNREIADTLYISVNTVKTHLSSLYQKLEVGRRSLAVKKGRLLKLIP